MIANLWAQFVDGPLISVYFALKIAIQTSYVWLPIFLFYQLFRLWLNYRRSVTIREMGSVLLEIKLPKVITKSPAGMEIIFTTFLQSGALTYYDAFVLGKVKPWFSLELASFGGDIHFYIWTPPKFRKLIENQIYAQYPGVEIHEAKDYSLDIIHDPKARTIWGTYFKLSKPDPYPIKTYIDYGLDKDPKEEYKIDPMTAVIEYLGGLKKGEQTWIQILVQAHKEEGIKDGRLFKKPDWKAAAKKEIDKIMKRDKKSAPGEFNIAEFTMTKGERGAADAIERSLSKFAFDVMIRGFYIGESEVFNPINLVGLIGSVRQYNSQDLNGLKLGWYTDFTDASKDWFNFFPFLAKFFSGTRPRYERQMLDAYKRRSFFQVPYKNFHGRPFVMTTEELATIFHFPGEVAATPTLARVVSKKGEPPSNLPTGKPSL